jgi:hypothetical protein
VTPTAVVFLGPTLPVAEANRLVDATFLPPARQGDVYRVVKRLRPAVIGIIDGYFHQSASVWHREILWAMAEGIHVLGAASMGALRAAELQKYGMRGVGRVFEAYRDGRYAPFKDPFEDDDEVAVIHGPPETDFTTVSEAMIDIRDTLARAAEFGVITGDMRDRLAALGKAMLYRERSLARILERALAAYPMSPALTALAVWLPHHQTSRKRLDAADMLREIRLLQAEFPGRFQARFHLEPVSVWIRFLEQEEMASSNDISEIEAAALGELRLQPKEWQEARRQAMLRSAAIEKAIATGAIPSDRAGRASLDRLRRSSALLTHRELAAWATENGLNEEGLARLMREEASLDLLEARCPDHLESKTVDHLRVKGRFAALAARSLAKRRWATETGILGRRPSGIAVTDLIDWFVAHRLGDDINTPPSTQELATWLGFRDLDSFIEALWLERAYTSRAEREEMGSKAHNS